MPALGALELSFENDIASTAAASARCVAEHLTTLKLTVDMADYITYECLDVSVSEILTGMPAALKSLTILNCVENEDIPLPWGTLPFQLEELTAEHDLDDDGCIAFLKVAAVMMPKLRSLSLGGDRMGIRALSSLLAYVPRMHCLRSLRLVTRICQGANGVHRELDDKCPMLKVTHIMA